MLPRSNPLAAGLVAVVITLALAGCDTGDGRDLRPADSNQTESISVPSLPAAVDPADPDAASSTVATLPLAPSTLPASVGDAGAVGAPWVAGGTIDARYTCDGANVSPALSWPEAPEATAEIGVAMVDDDAPDFVHWAVAGLPPERVSLADGEVPDGAVQGTNGAGGIGYTGPCPPVGEAHTYRIIVFYLNTPVTLPEGAPGEQLVQALTAGSFQTASVSGIYRRATS